MTISELQERMQAATSKGPSSVGFAPIPSTDDMRAAPKPDFGIVEWELPTDYRAWLESVGTFVLKWYSPAFDDEVRLELLSAGGIEETSDIVYIPEGVSIDDGVYLSTNHLVPFAAVGGEATFCFDTRSGPDYPVYYHHQDEPRAIIIETSEWDEGTPSDPDFASFGAWMAWLVTALEGDVDPEALGQPTLGVLSMFDAS